VGLLVKRPLGVTLFGAFFAASAVICLLSIITLASPGGRLEPMWRIDPHKREAFASLGGWGILLLAAVGVVCALSSLGLWHGARWGRWLALGILAVNGLGDAVAGIITDPHTLIGVPITAALIAYLLGRGARWVGSYG
jgi:hypothetical protein